MYPTEGDVELPNPASIKRRVLWCWSVSRKANSRLPSIHLECVVRVNGRPPQVVEPRSAYLAAASQPSLPVNRPAFIFLSYLFLFASIGGVPHF